VSLVQPAKDVEKPTRAPDLGDWATLGKLLKCSRRSAGIFPLNPKKHYVKTKNQSSRTK